MREPAHPSLIQHPRLVRLIAHVVSTQQPQQPVARQRRRVDRQHGIAELRCFRRRFGGKCGTLGVSARRLQTQTAVSVAAGTAAVLALAIKRKLNGLHSPAINRTEARASQLARKVRPANLPAVSLALTSTKERTWRLSFGASTPIRSGLLSARAPRGPFLQHKSRSEGKQRAAAAATQLTVAATECARRR